MDGWLGVGGGWVGIIGIKAISVQSIEIELGLTGTELGNNLLHMHYCSLAAILIPVV